jgi:hypothetical protein
MGIGLPGKGSGPRAEMKGDVFFRVKIASEGPYHAFGGLDGLRSVHNNEETGRGLICGDLHLYIFDSI